MSILFGIPRNWSRFGHTVMDGFDSALIVAAPQNWNIDGSPNVEHDRRHRRWRRFCP